MLFGRLMSTLTIKLVDVFTDVVNGFLCTLTLSVIDGSLYPLERLSCTMKSIKNKIVRVASLILLLLISH